MTAPAEALEPTGPGTDQKPSDSETLRDQLLSTQAELSSLRSKNAKDVEILNRRSTRLDKLTAALSRSGVDPTIENLEDVLGEKLTAAERQQHELQTANGKIESLTKELDGLKTKLDQADRTTTLRGLTAELNVLPLYQVEAETLLEKSIAKTEAGAYEVKDKENVLKAFREKFPTWIGSKAHQGSGAGLTEGEGGQFSGNPTSWDLSKKAEFIEKNGQEAYSKLVMQSHRAEQARKAAQSR